MNKYVVVKLWDNKKTISSRRTEFPCYFVVGDIITDEYYDRWTTESFHTLLELGYFIPLSQYREDRINEILND